MVVKPMVDELTVQRPGWKIRPGARRVAAGSSPSATSCPSSGEASESVTIP